jgi:Tfp pilus assembly PilM family ATPase
MNQYQHHDDEAADYSRQMDAAKARAYQLQSEAMAEIFAGIGQASRRAVRAASRFAGSLTRHAPPRKQECA